MGGTPYEWEIDLEEVERATRIDGKCPVCENPISLAVLESGYAVVIDYNLAENIKEYVQCPPVPANPKAHLQRGSGGVRDR